MVTYTTVINFLDHAKQVVTLQFQLSFDIHLDPIDAASVEDMQKTTAFYIAAFDNPAARLESSGPFTRVVSRFGHTVQSSVTRDIHFELCQ